MLAPDGAAAAVLPQQARVQRPARLRERVPREGALPRGARARSSARRFPHARWYGQRPSFFSVIAPEPQRRAGPARRGRRKPTRRTAAPRSASRSTSSSPRAAPRGTLGMLPATLSVLADRDDWVHRDYEKVMRNLETAGAQLRGAWPATSTTLATAREEAMKSRDERARLGRPAREPPRAGRAHRLASSRAASPSAIARSCAAAAALVAAPAVRAPGPARRGRRSPAFAAIIAG